MDTTDGVSLNLMRNIRLIIPQNVDNQRDQTGTVEQPNDCPSLSSQDCHCLWEAAKQSNVTEKLGHYFEKCSRELMHQIQRDSLLDRDKTAMLNFLCQYGILKMKMESSLNLKAVATSDGVVTVNGGIGRGGHSGDVRLNGSEYAEVSGLLSRQQDNEPVECFEKSGNIVNRRQKHCQAGENSFESATGNTDLERESSYVLSGSSSKQRHSRDVGNSCELLHVMCDSSNHGEDDDDVDFEGSSAGVSEWYHERENNRSDTGSSFSGIPDQEEGVTECIAGKIPESVCGRDQQGQGVAAATFVSTEQTESEHNNLDNSFDGSENATLQRQRFEDSIQTEKRNVKTEHEEEMSDADSEQKHRVSERSEVRGSQEDSLSSDHFEDQELPQAGDSYRFELEKNEEECQSGSTTIMRKPLQKTILGKKYLKSERARNRPDCAVSKTLHEGRETAMYWYVEEGGGADAHGGDSSKQELCMRNLRGPVNQEEPPVPVSIVQKYESASTADAVQRFESTDRSQGHIVEGDADLSRQQEKSPSLLPSNNDLGHVQTVLPSQLLPSNSAASDHPRTSPGQLLSRDMSVCGASLPSPLLPREQSTPYARAESLAYVLPRAISHSTVKFQRTTATTQELSTKRRYHRRSSQKILTQSQIELKREQDRIRQRRHREKMRRMKIAQIQWASTEKQRGFHKKKAMRQNFSNTSQSAVPVTLTRQANLASTIPSAVPHTFTTAISPARNQSMPTTHFPSVRNANSQSNSLSQINFTQKVTSDRPSKSKSLSLSPVHQLNVTRQSESVAKTTSAQSFSPLSQSGPVSQPASGQSDALLNQSETVPQPSSSASDVLLHQSASVFLPGLTQNIHGNPQNQAKLHSQTISAQTDTSHFQSNAQLYMLPTQNDTALSQSKLLSQMLPNLSQSTTAVLLPAGQKSLQSQSRLTTHRYLDSHLPMSQSFPKQAQMSQREKLGHQKDQRQREFIVKGPKKRRASLQDLTESERQLRRERDRIRQRRHREKKKRMLANLPVMQQPSVTIKTGNTAL